MDTALALIAIVVLLVIGHFAAKGRPRSSKEEAMEQILEYHRQELNYYDDYDDLNDED